MNLTSQTITTAAYAATGRHWTTTTITDGVFRSRPVEVHDGDHNAARSVLAWAIQQGHSASIKPGADPVVTIVIDQD